MAKPNSDWAGSCGLFSSWPRSSCPIAAVAVWYNAGTDEKPITAEPVKQTLSHWFHLSPDWFVISLLLGVCLLWLSDRFQWLAFNHHKGYAVLIAVAAVGVAALTMLLWWIVSLIFRWRFQFGIRSLLAFCLACSIAAGWFAVERERARRQREAIEAIESSGGAASYDWVVDGETDPINDAEPPEPRWLSNMLGEDFFSAVVRVNCNNSKITDAGLEHVKGFAELRELWLNDTDITDAGLERLKELTKLHVLSLSRTTITNAGLKHLTGLPHLFCVNLHLTNVTDDGLEQLKVLSQLKQLNLNNTGITDDGLKHLEGFTQLEWLDLCLSRATKAGVKRLQRALPNCTIQHY